MAERKRPANAIPSGGGGGGWAEFNRKRAERMAARMENLTFVKGSRDPENLDPVSAAILEVASTGTSIFDPVICEIAYRWFCPPGGTVLDPFAGGSVRGRSPLEQFVIEQPVCNKTGTTADGAPDSASPHGSDTG